MSFSLELSISLISGGISLFLIIFALIKFDSSLELISSITSFGIQKLLSDSLTNIKFFVLPCA